jgi:hypothetical protein
MTNQEAVTQATTNKKQFYVYLHSVAELGTFYVGKGDEDRCKVIARHNPQHTNVCMKYGTNNITVTLIPCANEQAALELETTMIIAMRKAGVQLVNQTSGNAGLENEIIKDLTQRLEGMEQYVTRIVAKGKKITIVEKVTEKVTEKSHDYHEIVMMLARKTKEEGMPKADFARDSRPFKKLSDTEQDRIIQDLIDQNKIAHVTTKQVSGQKKSRYIATEFIG